MMQLIHWSKYEQNSIVYANAESCPDFSLSGRVGTVFIYPVRSEQKILGLFFIHNSIGGVVDTV